MEKENKQHETLWGYTAEEGKDRFAMGCIYRKSKIWWTRKKSNSMNMSFPIGRNLIFSTYYGLRFLVPTGRDDKWRKLFTKLSHFIDIYCVNGLRIWDFSRNRQQ